MRRQAFTVMEMLVVLAILAILTGLTVLSVSHIQEKQLATQVKTESALLKTAAEAALNDGIESVDADTLVREGYLAQPIKSPRAGYRYDIIKVGDGSVRVEWKQVGDP